MDIVSGIIEWESGTLDDHGMLLLFAELIKTGQAWRLQGCYGRQAKALIDSEYISPAGVILKEGYDA